MPRVCSGGHSYCHQKGNGLRPIATQATHLPNSFIIAHKSSRAAWRDNVRSWGATHTATLLTARCGNKPPQCQEPPRYKGTQGRCHSKASTARVAQLVIEVSSEGPKPFRCPYLLNCLIFARGRRAQHCSTLHCAQHGWSDYLQPGQSLFPTAPPCEAARHCRECAQVVIRIVIRRAMGSDP